MKPTKAKPTKAKPTIRNDHGHYILEGALTHNGNPVVSYSLELIEEIAREWRELGRLDAVNDFGVYSSYCTFSEFIENKPFVTKDLAVQLGSSDHLIKPCTQLLCLWSDQVEFRNKARALLKDLGIKGDPGKDSKLYRDSIYKHLNALHDYEKAGFCLLNGMFGVPITMCLLLLHSRVTPEDISEVLNKYFQIDDVDSYSQQESNRISVGVIAKFVEMMRRSDPSRNKAASA